MYTPEASQLTLPMRSPAKTLCMRRSASPLKLALALTPTRQTGCTKEKSELNCFPRFVSVPPPAPFVTETLTDHGPSSRPPSTPSSDELKLVPVACPLKAASSSLRSEARRVGFPISRAVRDGNVDRPRPELEAPFDAVVG